MGFTIEVKIDMFCRVWTLYHDFPISVADGIGMTTTLSQEKSGGNQKLVEFFEARSIPLRVVGPKALQFSLQHQIPSPFCVFMVVVSKSCLCSSQQMGWEIDAGNTVTLISFSSSNKTRCLLKKMLHTRSQGTLQEWQLRTGWNVRSSYWMHKLHHLQARGINKSMRIAQKYNTKQAHEAHHWNKWHHVQLCMRHWMFRQDSKWQSQRHPWWFWFPNKFLHHPIVRRPTTRSACRDCWREKRNHLRTPDVRPPRDGPRDGVS